MDNSNSVSEVSRSASQKLQQYKTLAMGIYFGGQLTYYFFNYFFKSSLKQQKLKIKEREHQINQLQIDINQKNEKKYKEKMLKYKSKCKEYKQKINEQEKYIEQLTQQSNNNRHLKKDDDLETNIANLLKKLEKKTKMMSQEVSDQISRQLKGAISANNEKKPAKKDEKANVGKGQFEGGVLVQQSIQFELSQMEPPKQINTKNAKSKKDDETDDVGIYRICITGGPCAGKTTALAMLQSDLLQLGFTVLMVPEAATILMKGGAMIVSSSFTQYQGIQFQKALLKLQIALEQVFYQIGQMISEKAEVVILIDRGLMDGSAYVDKQQWQALLDELGITVAQLRDQRYDSVLHLVTAADGAEKFYDSETNSARYESITEAREKDYKLREAYMSHPKWYLIDNQVKDFDEKMTMVKAAVHHTLHAPIGEWFEGKYLVKHEEQSHSLMYQIPINLKKLPHHEIIDIQINFINEDSQQGSVIINSIEKRGNDDSGFCYFLNLKHRKLIDGKVVTINKRQNILPSQYFQLLDSKDPLTRTLRINRLVLIDIGHYYTLDHFPDIEGQPILLIVRASPGIPKDDRKFPPIEKLINIHRQVTNEVQYANYNMALLDYKMPQNDVEATNIHKKSQNPLSNSYALKSQEKINLIAMHDHTQADRSITPQENNSLHHLSANNDYQTSENDARTRTKSFSQKVAELNDKLTQSMQDPTSGKKSNSSQREKSPQKIGFGLKQQDSDQELLQAENKSTQEEEKTDRKNEEQ